MNKKVVWCTPGLRRFVSLLALLSCVILPSATACGAGAEGRAVRPIRVVMDNNYPPYVFLDGDGILQGILVDQWQLWQKKTGTPVEIKAIDWGSALRGMKEGDFDVIDTIFKTEERSGWLDFTRPYARLEVPVFFNKEISGISGVESLKGFAVAAKEGDAAVDLLRSHGVDNLLLFKGYEEIIRAAKEHKVNVFVVDKPPALYFLYKYGIQGQYKESPPLDVGQFHRAVKKGDKALLQQIEVGFARISTKELQQIEEKWYGSPILRSVRVEYFLAGAGILCLLILSLFFWNRSLRKAVENRTRELQISEERYRHLFNAESDAIVVIDIETLSHVEVNEAAVDLYGYSHDELMALRSTDLSAEPEEPLPQITGDSGRVRIPLRYHRKKDGTVFPVEIGARFFELNGRNLLLAAMRDVSERLQAEEERERLRDQLSQSHKMESIGRLAGGIAHDFNNMLGVILGHTELALLRVPSSEQIHSNLKEVEKAARRSADLTRQLLAFARKQTVVPKVLDLNETVTGMLNMLRRLIGEDIDLVWTPTEGLWRIKMDPSQIDQILANLCANGRDSITNIGRVVISTENANISAAYCTEHEGCAAGEYVMLSVTDNGCGMDHETLVLLFEPFYTTKEVGKGTGLGLATVYGIVQQNKGFIKVDSEPGRGTSFKVYLPRYSEPVVNCMQQDVTEPLSFGAGTVLLVEDEPAILEMATQMLEKIGYRVLSAETPSAAIHLAHEHAGKIDLLLTDVIMPEMNGWELSQKILQIQPGIKRLFTSGYTANAIAHHSVLDESLYFIQKPFTMQELSSKVCMAMEREPEGG